MTIYDYPHDYPYDYPHDYPMTIPITLSYLSPDKSIQNKNMQNIINSPLLLPFFSLSYPLLLPYLHLRCTVLGVRTLPLCSLSLFDGNTDQNLNV